jgi:hypothetical protein
MFFPPIFPFILYDICECLAKYGIGLKNVTPEALNEPPSRSCSGQNKQVG